MNEENEKSVNEVTDMGEDISPDEDNGDTSDNADVADGADVADAADIHALEEQVAALTAKKQRKTQSEEATANE